MVSAVPSRMPRQSLVCVTSSFPHEDDNAFALVLQLQSLIVEIAPVRGTAILRNKLQRALARLADCLIESASGTASGRREHLHELALLSCRRIAGFLRLLNSAAVLKTSQHEPQRVLVKQLAEI